MRVLFINNESGAMVGLIEWLIENNHEVRVIIEESEDPKRQTIDMDCAIAVSSEEELLLRTQEALNVFLPDVIQVSAKPYLVPAIKEMTDIPVVLSYHGDDVRGRETVHPEALSADKIIVTTPDLQQYGEWYDRLVPEWFFYKGGRKSNTVLMIYSKRWLKDERQLARKWCKERGLELTILDVDDKDNLIPYTEMSDYFSQFEFVLDFKGFDEHSDTLSKVALEALACGCKVVHDSDTSLIYTPIDQRRLPDQYVEMYQSLALDKIELASEKKVIA